MIVDKEVDLNVYKNTEVLNQVDEKGDNTPIDEMHPACCGTGGKPSSKPKEKAQGCCGTSENSSQPKEEVEACCGSKATGKVSQLIAGTDFNDWVGEFFNSLLQV